MIVPRERVHPGPLLDAFEERDGWRYTAFATERESGRSRHSTPGIARTPGSRIASASSKLAELGGLLSGMRMLSDHAGITHHSGH